MKPLISILFILLVSCMFIQDSYTADVSAILQQDTYFPMEQFSEGFPELVPLLDSINSSVEGHDWDRFITYCDPDNYHTQSGIGIRNKQYIFEILNLRTTGSGNYLKEIDNIMSVIKTMDIQFYKVNHAQEESYINFKGIIYTEENQKYEFMFELVVKGEDVKITGGVG